MAHYIDKDALVAEIERRIKSLHQVNSPREQAVLYECEDILSFVNTLEVKEVNEPVSDDLEEVAEYLSKIYAEEGSVDTKREGFAFYIGFKNGAKWQKEQMIAKAFDAKVLENYDGKCIEYDETILDEKLSDCNVFDKVKVIVIKEE